MASNGFPRDEQDAFFRRNALAALLVFLAGLAAYLVYSHYVKAYSDPAKWLRLGQGAVAGTMGREAPLYPLFLYAVLKLTGPFVIFLANGPFLVMMTYLAWRIASQTFEAGRYEGQTAVYGPLLAGTVTIAVLINFHASHYLYLLNPYREAVAFSLLLGSVIFLIAFVEGRGMTRAVLAALLLGLAVCARETCVIFLPPALLLLLTAAVRDRSSYFLRGTGIFLVFFLVGMLPFLLYNFHFSSNPFVPAYAEYTLSKTSGEGSLFPRDIPIPGMSLSHFQVTGKKMLKMYANKYGLAGAAFILAGIASSLRRTNLTVLILLLPAAVLNFLFYAFYHTKRWRFYVIIDLMLVPILAIGAAVCFGFVASRLERRFRGATRLLTIATVWALTLFTLAGLAQKATARRHTTKVWHLDQVRDFIQPHLEKPFAFVGMSHYSQMLSWILQSPYTTDEIKLDKGAVAREGMERVLERKRDENFASLASRNLYFYFLRSENRALLRRWFDFEPVLSLAGLDVPLERYNRPLRGEIYRVVPWTRNSLVQLVPLPPSGKALLLKVDLFRLWDYRERSFCRLYVNGRLLEERVPNGVHFIALPGTTAGDAVEIAVESDAPLPADPVLAVHAMEAGMEIRFGSGTNRDWYYPWLSREILAEAPLKPAGFLLQGTGTIDLPRYCPDGDSLLVTFRTEDLLHPGEGTVHHILAQAGTESVRMPLGRKGTSTDFIVNLGQSGGSLAMVPVRLSSQGPGQEEGAVKFRQATLRCDPAARDDNLSIDVGGGTDTVYLLEGFYPPEKHQGRIPVRWTDGRGVVRLPGSGQGGTFAVEITTIDFRPAESRSFPGFTFKGRGVPRSRVVTSREGEKTVYSFQAPRTVGGVDEDVLIIECAPWVPGGHGTGADGRSLGLLVDRIEVRRL